MMKDCLVNPSLPDRRELDFSKHCFPMGSSDPSQSSLPCLEVGIG